jgi:hypothetical protein
MFTGKILPKMALHGLTFGEHCVDLVPYSRKPFTQFSPHALRGIKNKKAGECFKINLKVTSKALIPAKHGHCKEYPHVGC